MLVIVMHNNLNYLESLIQLAKRKEIAKASIVKQEGLGVRLIGGEKDFILSGGHSVAAYDKAFVAHIPSDEKTKHFIETIDKDIELQRLNLDTRGFVCIIPFQYVEHLNIESLGKD